MFSVVRLVPHQFSKLRSHGAPRELFYTLTARLPRALRGRPPHLVLAGPHYYSGGLSTFAPQINRGTKKGTARRSVVPVKALQSCNWLVRTLSLAARRRTNHRIRPTFLRIRLWPYSQ
jgi:hypothetical protein